MPNQMSVVINTLAKTGVDPKKDQLLSAEGKCESVVEIYLSSSNPRPTTLVIEKFTNGVNVYINEPVVMSFKNLQKLLKERASIDMEEHDVLKRFLNATSVSCNAFYYKKETDKDKKEKVTFLIEFALGFHEDETGKGGLISSLTGCPEIENLFDINGVSVSLIQCKPEDRDVLQKYAASLVASGKPPAIPPPPEKQIEDKTAEDKPKSTNPEPGK